MSESLRERGVHFSKNELIHMSPEDKQRAIRGAIRKLIKEHPGGIASRDLEQKLNLHHKTVKKHLDYLTATREIYKKDYGARSTVYFPNSRLGHPTRDETRQIGDKVYSFSLIENPFGRFVYIQERSRDHHNIENVVGGVMVRYDDIHDFIEQLRGFAREVNQ